MCALAESGIISKHALSIAALQLMTQVLSLAVLRRSK